MENKLEEVTEEIKRVEDEEIEEEKEEEEPEIDEEERKALELNQHLGKFLAESRVRRRDRGF